MEIQILKEYEMLLEYGDGQVSKERIEFVEERLNIRFPKSFLNLIHENDGGSPSLDFDEIRYFDPDSSKNRVTGINGFLTIEESEYYSLLDKYFNPPEGFPKDLVGFAFLGSDRFCFDYREGKHLTDPPIVYWIQGNEEGKDIAFLANNFEEFIGMFKPEGYYDHLLGGGSDQD